MELIPHPAFPPRHVTRIFASVSQKDPRWLQARWRVEGAGAIVVPVFAGRRRADGLWRTTCFELFCGDGPSYAEFNFAPSEAWAAYDFDGYREGMRDRPVSPQPTISWRGGRSSLAILDVAIPRAAILSGALAISAVIEEEGGAKSFWALAHPPGDPDFHHRTCFAATLAPPVSP
ncbi:hypothetical protein GRI47_04865 [Erythrobacter pelagi]|uniref:DOMON-like domain-containing protein n=1 Tax=Qipengyuania pelagi TaxID=994320 RepID=A0A844Y8I2_9SPHN|nr:DOMON-like domain-containing protein [Qipengyuania pelagi]MXO53338.1 hypothetical protein [Qipengyuania pelagi]